MTNLVSRPAPLLARTVTGLSSISGDRFILGIGAGVCGRNSSLSEFHASRPENEYGRSKRAIIVVRALSGGGDPVRFDGEFYQDVELNPSAAPTPPIWIGALGPKGLAVTGRNADGWMPEHLADWRSTLVAESRPIIDEAAARAGRDPADVVTVYNVSRRVTRVPLQRPAPTMDRGS